MKVIYVAGPFRGANGWEIAQHVHRAEVLAYQVAQLGAMPLCPHTNTRHSHGLLSEEFWLDGTLELMSRCDAVIVTPDWGASIGACAEVIKARQLNLPVFETLDALHDWLQLEVNR